MKPVANFPGNPSQIGHIFRSRHNITDTPETRIEIQSVVNQRNYLGADIQGNSWYARINQNGTQTWVSVMNGTIQNAGINKVGNIRTFNPLTGLSGR
ncbi:MAG: hypothetical protein SFU25_01290 [Candidatus Caenarcaniphilales bacterium]|nr:hypothetical protein [Candidatus Caenarcaniphilales bacterium]